MDTHDLRLLGDTALRKLEHVCNERFRSWAKNWCVDDGSRAKLVTLRRPCDDDRSRSWKPADNNRHNLIFVAPGCDTGTFAAALANVKQPDGTSPGKLESLAGEHAIADLNNVFGAGITEFISVDVATPWLFQPLAGSAIAEFRIGDETLAVLLSPALIGWLVPRTQPGQLKKLVSAKESISSSQVQLTVSLNLGRLTLNDLRDLQPGDCVTTGVPLDAILDLRLNDFASIAGCRLGRTAGQRAVLIEKRESNRGYTHE